ncbi:MAG: hypothetical protein J1D88_09560 [Treponema sp.]|nr:hypothetical protein [Treponema sp.]
MKGYEVYVGEKALRVVGEGYADGFINAKVEGITCDLDFALKNCTKPFITFGLPKKLKKYIEKRAKNFISMSDGTEYDLVAVATLPEEEHLIQVFTTYTKTLNMSEKNKKEWHGCSNYIMTIEQAKVYQEYFPENRFYVMGEYWEEFSKTGIKDYDFYGK